jgi:3-oxoacyl-[acyl-carrier-protein] synthase-3
MAAKVQGHKAENGTFAPMNNAVVIAGTGSVLPEVVVPNSAFLDRNFMDDNGNPFAHSNEVIIQKFQQITEIEERRYARNDQNSSDLAAEAGRKAQARRRAPQRCSIGI